MWTILKLLGGIQPNYWGEDIPPIPPLFRHHCSQAVGRLIKVVTEASKAVCGPKSRDRFIRARTASRQLMPRFAGLSIGMGFPWEYYGKQWRTQDFSMGGVFKSDVKSFFAIYIWRINNFVQCNKMESKSHTA